MKTTRKQGREHLGQFHLACELVKLIRHFFPDLIPMLKKLRDPRHQSYITYPGVVLLMTRILSSLFYINSMRKTSEEFNSETVIQNIWEICGEKTAVFELPYWETINRYLAGLDPAGLQRVVCQLCRRLLRSRAFEGMRVNGKYWQVLIDGTQLYSSREELDGRCLYRIHKKGTAEEYRENYYYVLEAKLVLHPKVVVSIMTEFVENRGGEEMEKQDCERKACWRLMEKLKKEFPHLRLCVCADSLYACERFLYECREREWTYLLRFKEGSIPYIAGEYRALRKEEKNLREKVRGEKMVSTDYVVDINYEGHKTNLMEYQEHFVKKYKKGKKKGKEEKVRKEFWFLTDLRVSKKNVEDLSWRGRLRWKIENEGFNAQKRHGYNLEHQYSKNYQAQKNHYYLIQIGHMIAQLMEAWGKLWEGVKESVEQHHRRLLESFKKVLLKEHEGDLLRRIQIRFI